MLTRAAKPIPNFRPAAHEGQPTPPELRGVPQDEVKGQDRLRELLSEHSGILDFISSTGDLAKVLSRVAGAAERFIAGSRCAMQVTSADGRKLQQTIAPGLPPAYADAITGATLPNAATPGGVVLASQGLVSVDDAASGDIDPAIWTAAAAHKLRAFWGYPLLDQNGNRL